MKSLVVLQCACFVALVGLLVTQLAAPRAEPMLQQELQALRNDLRELLAAVARAATAPPASPLGTRDATAPYAAAASHLIPPMTRTPAPDPMGAGAGGAGHRELDLLSRVEGLEAAIRRLHLLAGAGGNANAVAEAARTRPVADWAALDRVRERLQQDYAATRSSLLLLTPAQLVEAFGRPTEIYHHQERTVWTYQRGEHSVSFTVDGLVIDV